MPSVCWWIRAGGDALRLRVHRGIWVHAVLTVAHLCRTGSLSDAADRSPRVRVALRCRAPRRQACGPQTAAAARRPSSAIGSRSVPSIPPARSTRAVSNIAGPLATTSAGRSGPHRGPAHRDLRRADARPIFHRITEVDLATWNTSGSASAPRSGGLMKRSGAKNRQPSPRCGQNRPRSHRGFARAGRRARPRARNGGIRGSGNAFEESRAILR